MKELDRNRPFGTIHGHEWACFEQDGILFDGTGKSPHIDQKPIKLTGSASSTSAKNPDTIIPTPKVDSARMFLENLLGQGPVAKSVIYSESQKNNQNWEAVKDAMLLMEVETVKIGQGNRQEAWKLKEYK